VWEYLDPDSNNMLRREEGEGAEIKGVCMKS
jgi:hypothetical protein